MSSEDSKQYSLAEVKKHNNNKSTWIVIHNDVYDVTSFLNEHPGGEEVLLDQAGSDASEAFEDVGHSSDARSMMKKYLIGQVVEAERKPVNRKADINWETSADGNPQSSMKSWLIPLGLGVLATLIYRFFLQSQ